MHAQTGVRLNALAVTHSLIHHNSPHACLCNCFEYLSIEITISTSTDVLHINLLCGWWFSIANNSFFHVTPSSFFLFFIIWLFLFLVFFPISLNAFVVADFIYLSNSMSESISMNNHWNINQIAYISICQKSFDWSANVGIARIPFLFLYLVL